MVQEAIVRTLMRLDAAQRQRNLFVHKKIPVSVITRLLNVNRLTVRNYIRTRKLQKPAAEKVA